MQHQEGTFKNDRGQKIFYEGWLPDGTAKVIFFSFMVWGIRRTLHQSSQPLYRWICIYGSITW